MKVGWGNGNNTYLFCWSWLDQQKLAGDNNYLLSVGALPQWGSINLIHDLVLDLSYLRSLTYHEYLMRVIYGILYAATGYWLCLHSTKRGGDNHYVVN